MELKKEQIDKTQRGFLQAVLDRLDERGQCRYTAAIIFRGIRRAFVAEDDIITVCGKPDTEFLCSFAFSCNAHSCVSPYEPLCQPMQGEDSKWNCGGTTFSCKTTYTACAPATPKGTFSCTSFDCKQQIFDCMKFQCNPEAGKTYTCHHELDFLCGWYNQCGETFDCSSGHGYFCTNQVSCSGDLFTCSGGTGDCKKKEGGEGSTTFYCVDEGNPPYDCPDFNAYSDKLPGDFRCGWPQENGQNLFSCYIEFDCQAADDFDCMPDSKFRCGGDKWQKFDCTSKGGDDQFHCRKLFLCQDAAKFKCNESGTPYTCSSVYCTGSDLAAYDCAQPYYPGE